MARIWKDNAYSTLPGSLSAVATTLTVQTGHGVRFPAITGSDHMLLTLQNSAGAIEIVKVTAHTAAADSMTIVRAQDGTTGLAWVASDVVEMRVTASAHTAYESSKDALADIAALAKTDSNIIVGDGTNWVAESGATARTSLGAAADASTQTAWIPAGAMVARTTAGAAAGTVESTTNKIMLKTLDFDAAALEYAQFTIRMPKGWNEGTVTAKFVWSSTVTGDVVWGMQAVAISNDDPFDAAFGTAYPVTDSVTATTDLMESGAATVTIGGTPTEGDLVVFQVYRDGTAGADTAAADARLHGVVLNYTTTSLNDA